VPDCDLAILIAKHPHVSCSRSDDALILAIFPGGFLQFVRRLRIPALFCALAVLVCELISHPYAEMGIADDRSFLRTAQQLAITGHLLYNGWATPILGWQVYLGAAFIKLFGYSLTTVRMSTLLVAMVLAFVLQRTMVRAGLNERNATIGTLALVLSPLYLTLSVTFMTDICGLFAIVVCLYGCLRAVQASSVRANIAWLCFAVAANAIFGTARQIAWLGILVIVPSALWLLRAQRRVVVAGGAATLAGTVFILACVHWFKQQPYSIPEHLLVSDFSIIHLLGHLLHTFLDIPFLLLPIMALFLPELRNTARSYRLLVASGFVCYLLLAIHKGRLLFLEPAAQDHFGVNVHGMFDYTWLQGEQPILLHTGARILLTILSIGGLLGLIASLLRFRPTVSDGAAPKGVSWSQLCTLLGPFTVVYFLLLVPRAATLQIFERYTLALLVVALVILLRYYQERIHAQVPLVALLIIAIMATLGIAVTHNTFALYRARIALAGELRADGIPDTSVDNGWEYNFGVELEQAGFINDPRIVIPAHAYVPAASLPSGSCHMFSYDQTPLVYPIYGVSFDPNACDGPAPFAPVRYSRWLASTPGTLYVVRYTKSSKP
jgi:hypothetical protein